MPAWQDVIRGLCKHCLDQGPSLFVIPCATQCTAVCWVVQQYVCRELLVISTAMHLMVCGVICPAAAAAAAASLPLPPKHTELVALEREVGGLMAQQAAAEACKATLDMQVRGGGQEGGKGGWGACTHQHGVGVA
jgi:hypothetical protein